ncbi:KH domain protein [Ancylostoma ceylanicum]|uniref:KH domain protein n=1 Tax=Ancylostoma ceylanicum TaxID=53326 RepID=A0A0D6LIN9_9BILA|nr:KH domain protein [Ancylostoma ceylanicum]
MTADSAALLQSHQHHANGTHLTRYASLINRLPRHTAHLLIAPDQEALRHRSSVATGQQYSVEYLSQLLKDKKQLSAFPNVFHHLERLADEEISKVRVALFQFEFTKEEMSLPEPEGDVQITTEKVFVPAKEHPDYNFVGRILGPRGMTAKQLEQETGCKIMVRGRGSMRDKKKEELNRGKPNWEHLSEDLHVLIQCEDTPNRARIKLARAVDEVKKLLVPAVSFLIWLKYLSNI